MVKGANFEVERDLPPDEPGDRRSRRAGEDGARGAHAHADASTVEPHHHSLTPADAVRRSADDLVTTSRGTTDSRDPGVEHPGRFFGPHRPAGPAPADKSQRRRKTVSHEKEDAAQFHDSDSAEDVYDLYNACNGIVINGLLDISKLDELSPEEAEVLNLRRLREVWAHTASGCARCQVIIKTLNLVRGKLREGAAESTEEQPERVDVNITDPIS